MFIQYTSLINLIQKAFNMGGCINADLPALKLELPRDLYCCFLCCGRLGSEISSASLDGSEFTSIFWALKYTANRIEQNNEMMLHLSA